MSQIAKISVYSHCNDIGGKVWNPAIRWTKKYAVFVTVESDDGIAGIGECWCFDSSPDVLVAYLRTEVIPQLIGVEIDAFPGVVEALTKHATLTARHGILSSAISGIDIAVWDLRSRKANSPLWQYLKINGSGTAPLYASGGLYGADKDPDTLAAEMSGMASDGFSLVKMKIGALDCNQDRQRIEAVIAALPEKTKLIIDGVYSYNPDTALNIFESLPTDRIEAFQSPVPADDFKGMQYLTSAGVPVMATEAEYRAELHQELVESNAVKFLQTAPIASGGVSRVLSLAELVKGTSVRLSLEISSTAIALMASSHLAAAIDEIAHVEFHYLHQVFFEDLSIQMSPDSHQRFKLADETGLAISLRTSELTEEFIENSSVITTKPNVVTM